MLPGIASGGGQGSVRRSGKVDSSVFLASLCIGRLESHVSFQKMVHLASL